MAGRGRPGLVGTEHGFVGPTRQTQWVQNVFAAACAVGPEDRALQASDNHGPQLCRYSACTVTSRLDCVQASLCISRDSLMHSALGLFMLNGLQLCFSSDAQPDCLLGI
jgi:hypothetical protein